MDQISFTFFPFSFDPPFLPARGASLFNFVASPLLLASASPRRREILELLGISYQTVPVNFPELTHRKAPWLSPGELALHNAKGKAESVKKQFPKKIILAADTVVALGPRIFEKPATLTQAKLFLQEFSGQTHDVTTALVVASPPGNLATVVTVTQVTFRNLSLPLIEKYLRHVHVLDKAGGYAIQEHGEWIIQSIKGSITNVIGLPVEALAEVLSETGLAGRKTDLFPLSVA